MERTVSRWVAVAALVFAALISGEARAQVGPRSAGSVAPMQTPGFYTNPYATPYANPFLNPYLTQMNATPQNAALYLFAAQQATGGIGSGQLSGVRPGPRTPRHIPQAPPAAQEKDAANARGVPTSVSRYFRRGDQSTGTETHFNRQGRYYPQNRR